MWQPGWERGASGAAWYMCMYGCIRMAESLHCSPETITTWLISFIQYKIKSFKKKKSLLPLNFSVSWINEKVKKEITWLCSTYWKSTTFNICAKMSIVIVFRAPSTFPWTHTHPSQGCAMNEDIFLLKINQSLSITTLPSSEKEIRVHTCAHIHILSILLKTLWLYCSFFMTNF